MDWLARRQHTNPSDFPLRICVTMNDQNSSDQADSIVLGERMATQNRIDHDGIGVSGVSDKLWDTNCVKNAPRVTMAQRTVRKKEDSPLAQMCQWIVQHQIGMAYMSPEPAITNRDCRAIRQFTSAACINSRMLSKSTPTHTQIRGAFLLQLGF